MIRQIVTLLCVFISLCLGSCASENNKNNNGLSDQVNTTQKLSQIANMYNLGLVLEDTQHLYFAEQAADNKSYNLASQSKEDGTITTIVENVQQCYLISGDWLYYANSANNNYLYRVNTQDGSQELFLENWCNEFIIGQNGFFFTTLPSNYLYFLPLDTYAPIEIVAGPVRNIYLYNENLYYTSDGGIYQLNEGELEKDSTLIFDSVVKKFFIIDGVIYFHDQDDLLKSVVIGGHDVVKLYPRIIALQNIANCNLVFSAYTAEGLPQTLLFNLDTCTSKSVLDKAPQDIYVVGQQLFFYEENGTLTQKNVD